METLLSLLLRNHKCMILLVTWHAYTFLYSTYKPIHYPKQCQHNAHVHQILQPTHPYTVNSDTAVSYNSLTMASTAGPPSNISPSDICDQRTIRATERNTSGQILQSTDIQITKQLFKIAMGIKVVPAAGAWCYHC